MFVALLQFDVTIDGAASLKDKRRVLRSIKDRLHRDHQVSVAEVGLQDVWNRGRLGLAAVSGDAVFLRSTLDRIEGKLRAWPDARLAGFTADVVPVEALTSDDRDEDGSPLWTEAERRDEPREKTA
jgi:uncharacterized protein